MKLWQKLLLSERFWAALTTLVIVIGVAAWSWNEAEAQEIASKVVTAVVVICAMFIGGKTLRKSEPPA